MSALGTADRYWQTLRHLRWVQLYGRVVFRLARPRPDLSAAPRRRAVVDRFQPPARRSASMVGPGEFSLLNEAGRLDETGWDDPAREKLWRYNLHYFDDLNAFDAAARAPWHRALLRDWRKHNPPGQGSGWEPYPTSLRIVNWIKWARAGHELPPGCEHSLAIQARWLSRRLETHLLGNHLFANAKALVFAGLFFEGDEPGGWLKRGLSILRREIPEQILPDGGQFELSPMYHALALEDILDLVNVMACFEPGLGADGRVVAGECAARIPAMQRWHHAMCHPDGGIAFFNDAAFGIAPSVSELDAYAIRLGFKPAASAIGMTRLPDSGYTRLSQPQAVLLVDHARIGPDYLPGHAHADTLSFELSLYGQRVFVNSGTSIYGTGPERLRQRGTAAHNTVIVGGQDSSEVWSGFRVARRARPQDVRTGRVGDALSVEAAHDGYRRLPGAIRHWRRWLLAPGRLTIEDHLSSADLPAQARFHLHPDVRVCQAASNQGTCRLADGRSFWWRSDAGEVRVEPSSWHPEFGLSLAASCLVISLSDGRSVFEVGWE